MIGITVWAKKPVNPGKPSSPEPEIADYQIWIGNGPLGSPEDVVLQSYDELDHLVVENVGYSGRWLPPPTKGKYKIESWRVDVDSLDPGGEPGDYCGTYIINNATLAGIMGAHGIDSGDEAYDFRMDHSTQNHPQLGENDYWYIEIAWQVDTLAPSYPDIPHLLGLIGYTNMDTEWEGVYDEINDTWTVTFDNAWFWLIENTENYGEIVELWNGQLSFTVEIKRTLVQS